jgi:myo-inositol-1(or 4)-monophosphatase
MTTSSHFEQDQALQPIDAGLLAAVVDATHVAGARLLAGYSPLARPAGREEMFLAGGAAEKVSLESLQAALMGAHHDARWVEDDQETIVLEGGDWWSVDAVEGNVNYVHGLPEWCVSVALIRDNVPVLAAIYEPVAGRTYTAIQGGGAWMNGTPLRTSKKTDLAVAIATTAQAEAGQENTYRRIGDSITAMLGSALLVRATVPSTFSLLMVAAGQADLFWQYEPVLPGLAPGALLIAEAGGIVTDTRGRPWRPGSADFLASAPGVHAAVVRVLSSISAS